MAVCEPACLTSAAIWLLLLSPRRPLPLRSRARSWWWQHETRISAALVGAAAIAITGALVVSVKYGTPWLADTGHLDPEARAAELGRVRTAVLASFAGLIAVAGAELTRRSYKLSRSAQITERFSRAVDHIGSEQVDVQVGGIFALERIAKDSRIDHQAVIELLTEFVRLNAYRESVRGDSGEDEPVTDLAYDDEEIRELLIFERPPERGAVQAAMTVVARREQRNDRNRRLDLRSSDLSRLDLHEAKLAHAKLYRTTLERAWLSEADLQNASLTDCCLDDVAFWKARLGHVRLQRSSMRRAWLEGAQLAHAQMQKCDLRGADFRNADLTGARLDTADLRGANLTGATITDVVWDGARFNDATTWPAGFGPPAAAQATPD